MDRAATALTLSAVGLVPAIFGAALPPLSTVRGMPPSDDMRHAECVAVAVSAVVVGTIAVMANAPDVAVIGGGMVVAYACLYRSARRR